MAAYIVYIVQSRLTRTQRGGKISLQNVADDILFRQIFSTNFSFSCPQMRVQPEEENAKKEASKIY